MSNIFAETKEVQEINKTHDYRANKRELKEKMMAEGLGINTTKILAVLSEEPNQNPYQFLLESTKHEVIPNLIWLEDLDNSLSAHVLQRDGQELGAMDIISNTVKPMTPMDELVTQQTYDSLRTLVVDQEIVNADVDTKLRGTI